MPSLPTTDTIPLLRESDEDDDGGFMMVEDEDDEDTVDGVNTHVVQQLGASSSKRRAQQNDEDEDDYDDTDDDDGDDGADGPRGHQSNVSASTHKEYGISALPLPRPVSTSPTPLFLPSAISDSNTLVAGSSPTPTTSNNAPSPGTVDSGASTPRDGASTDNTSSANENGRDRIGTFFGYNGTDAYVPKAAYDAVSQRVRTLETSLGSANRELRTNGTTIAEQQATITHLTQQLQQKEALLRAAEEREAMLTSRERELQEREHTLEAMSRQLRKMKKRDTNKRGGGDPISSSDACGDCPHCMGSGTVGGIGSSGIGTAINSQQPLTAGDFVRRRARRTDGETNATTTPSSANEGGLESHSANSDASAGASSNNITNSSAGSVASGGMVFREREPRDRSGSITAATTTPSLPRIAGARPIGGSDSFEVVDPNRERRSHTSLGF